MKHTKTLFSFPGFWARSHLQGVFGNPHARLVVLVRRKKLPFAPAIGCGTARSTTARRTGCGIPMQRTGASICRLSNGGGPALSRGESGAPELAPASPLYAAVGPAVRHPVPVRVRAESPRGVKRVVGRSAPDPSAGREWVA